MNAEKLLELFEGFAVGIAFDSAIIGHVPEAYVVCEL